MNKPLTVMIIDGATWYSEDDWKALVAQKLELEERLKAATDDAKEAEAYAEEIYAHTKKLEATELANRVAITRLEATLRKLEYWFDTDQEILDVMGNNEKADHMRKLKMIRDALGGGNDE